MNGELLRIIDSIHRDKDISLDILFGALEDAMASALRKRMSAEEEISVAIDRETGEITVEGADEPVDPANLGRIAAQTAKQVIIQKIREAERDVILRDYEARLYDIVNGTVQRVEGGHVIINLGKTEGILPRREQIRDERYRVGERVRCYVLDVKKAGSNVRIILSRSHPELIKKLFELEVPEITERIIEIRALAREPGYRTKIAVTSVDLKVDAVGACVGVRGTRIKNIVSELSGERIDIVRWSDQPDIFIANALNPAEVEAISLNPRARLARVIVAEDQLSRAIGALGQNVRLASKLTEWDIDVMSQKELDGELDRMKEVLADVPKVGAKTIEKLFGSGFSMKKLATTSADSLLTVGGISDVVAANLTEVASKYVAERRSLARQARNQAAQEAAAEAAEPVEEAPAEGAPAEEEPSEEAPEDTGEAQEAVAADEAPEESEAAQEEEEAAETETEVEALDETSEETEAEQEEEDDDDPATPGEEEKPGEDAEEEPTT
jgi:N utilization substance protein A